MEQENLVSEERYYLKKVDLEPDAIYCHHGFTEELLILEHSHAKAQFLYTEGGIVQILIGGKTYFLPARHYMWIPAGVKHSIHPSSTQVTMRNLYFPIDQMKESFYHKLAIYPVNEFLFQFILFTQKYSGSIQPSSSTDFEILNAFKILLPQLGIADLPLSLPSIQDTRLLQVSEYLNKNLSTKFVFPALSKQFGFSERSLSRLFKAELNMSFIQYLTILRMLRSLSLILDDKLPINEVASLVGFNSVPTFSNTFYKILGVRPSAYLKLSLG